MEKRITVKELRDKFNVLVEKGMGDKFIGVGEYYLGEGVNTDDGDNGIWNSIYMDEVYFEDIPLTNEQKEYMKKKSEEFKKNNPDLYKPLKGITFKK
jgi:hypothetical protein